MKLYGAFVGVNKYQDARINNLAYAENDAKSFYRLMSENFPEEKENLHLLIGDKATKRSVLRLVGQKIANSIEPDDTLLFYFAGHGSPEIDASSTKFSNRYLIPYDAEYDSLFTTAIDLANDFDVIAGRIRCDKFIIILDACFSGRKGGRTFEGAFLRRENEDMRSVSRQFSSLCLGEGRVMFSACKEDEVALETGALGHGIFTYSILQTLTNPRIENDTISITKLYDEVLARVHEHSHKRQTPCLLGSISNLQLPVLKLEEGTI